MCIFNAYILYTAPTDDSRMVAARSPKMLQRSFWHSLASLAEPTAPAASLGRGPPVDGRPRHLEGAAEERESRRRQQSHKVFSRMLEDRADFDRRAGWDRAKGVRCRAIAR